MSTTLPVVAAPTPLVGREGERDRLVAVLARCRAGSGGLVLVSGEAGVGKSRLVSEVLAGWPGRVLSATAVPGAGAYAVLTALWAGADDRGRLDPAAGLPQAVRRLAAEGPTTLVLEDLHHADEATLRALPALAGAAGSEALVVVGVYRSDGLPRTHALRGVRAELRRAGRLEDIALRPLTEEGTARLLAGRLGSPVAPRLAAAVHARTAGLPFFVEEVAVALDEGEALETRAGEVDLVAGTTLPLPESVLDAVVARTAGLRDAHRDAVEYAAAWGVGVDLPALAEIAGPGEVDALLEAGLLLEVEPEAAEFRHTLVREALYRSTPWGRRRRCHADIADTLTTRGAPPAVVAEHWIAAHEPDRARPLLLAAAEEHCAVHAYRDAVTATRRALSLWPAGADPAGRLRVLERLADCAELSGDAAAAAGTWVEVAQRHRASGAPGSAGAAHRRAANAADLVGDADRAAVERRAAAEAFTEAGRPGEAAAERLALAEQLKSAGRLSEALEQAQAAAGLAEAGDRRDVRAHALAVEGALRSALGEGRRGVELARSGLELALSGSVTTTAGAAYYELGEALEYAADYAAAVNAYESAFEMCRVQGLAEAARTCYACMSPAVRLMGDWDRTLSVCSEVLADPESEGLARAVAEEESGLILALRGDRRRARGPLRRAADFGQAQGVFGLEVGAVWGLAVVAELDEDEAAAGSAVLHLLERCAAVEECHYALPALRWAASFLAERGDAEGVAGCHRVVATLATRNGAAKVLSALAHAGAELALVQGDANQGSAQFARSVELLAGITAPFEEAHTQVRWGQAAGSLGQRETAVTALTHAYRTARRLGARPLTRRAADVLAGMGEQVDQRLGRLAARSLDGVGLTRRELEVLRYVAEGRTNREIAATLFLSTRTVDMHVRNVLAKLDCNSRTAAVRRATESGLVGAPG